MEINNSPAFFKQLIANPDLAEPDAINQLIAQYPYISALWFIKVKKSINKEDQNSEVHLQQAALISPNSELLYRFINQVDKEEPKVEEPSILSTKDPEEASQKPSLYHDDSMPYSFIWWLNKTRIDHAENFQPYAQKQKGSGISHNLKGNDPLDQQMREHIFHIQAPELKLSDGDRGETVAFKVPKKENPIIDKFINEEPQIKPPSPEKVSLENKARKSAIDESGFVSETLARIYTEQGLHHKAIDTYKKLSLKFPEKSLYFVDLIKQLEKHN